MKKVILKIVIIACIACFLGCSDSYFDVNTPSGAAMEDQLRMNDLLGPAIFSTVNAQYFAERNLGNYTQYFTGRSGGAIGATGLPSTWSETYLGSLPDLQVIIKKAEEVNATHFGAVAKILVAINLGLVTDSYGNIPYSDALFGPTNPTPFFDSQEDIYVEIDTLLSSAIVALEDVDESDFTILTNNDLIYGGNLDQWLKAAYTLKARYQLHFSEVNGIAAATAALASLVNGFTSNSDDFEMDYPANQNNPWHSREVLAPNTSNDHDKIGDQLVSYMNGTSYPFNTITIDPRLPVYADNEDFEDDPGAPWRGYVSGGLGLSSDGEDGNTNFADEGFYTSANSPIVIITYAEAMFIKAEAEFLVNGGAPTSIGSNNAAYTAYLAGIQANMDKLDVDGSAYLEDASIALGEGALMLQHIMKEKYIANFLNPETFVDFRRYDFSTDVFKDLALPVDHLEGEYPNEWLVRAQYPDVERARNSENVIANEQLPTTPVWWDQ